MKEFIGDLVYLAKVGWGTFEFQLFLWIMDFYFICT